MSRSFASLSVVRRPDRGPPITDNLATDNLLTIHRHIYINKRPMGLDALLQNQLGHLPKFHIYSLSRGSKLSLLLLYGQWFPRFSKLPYLRMKLGHWPKCQKLHIYPLSPPRGGNRPYFSSMGSGFRDTGRFSKLPYLGMKLGKWPKFQKLHIYPLSTPGG